MFNRSVPAGRSSSHSTRKSSQSTLSIFGSLCGGYLISHVTLARRSLSLGMAIVVCLAVQPVWAGSSVAMPQTDAFAAAYETAQSLAKEFPGSRLVSVASTYSMYPMIDWDSIVVIAPASLNQVRVGDVVCFRDSRMDGPRTVLHRVERILAKDGRLVTRGDHLEHADPHLVLAESLVGRAVYIVYFDRSGEQRPVSFAMAAPKRSERVVKLFRD